MGTSVQAKVRVAGAVNPVSVEVTSPEKPELSHDIMDGWQSILNLLATIAAVPAALITKVEKETIGVLLSSENEGNPYSMGEGKRLGTGLYCETVIGEDRRLEVPNALDDEVWKDNPDIKLNMVSYFGLPVKWPDGEVFGTICVLDEKERIQEDTLKQIMDEFRNVLEKDLSLRVKSAEIEILNRELKEISLRDGLTGLYNHRAIHEFLFIEIQNSIRYDKHLTIAMVDIDDFKNVNDQYGHKTGDLLLKEIAELMKSRFRDADILGRYGGDEFLAIFTDTTKEDAYGIIERFRKNAEEAEGIGIGVTISAGLAYLEEKCTADELISKADEALYKAKNRGRNKVVDY